MTNLFDKSKIAQFDGRLFLDEHVLRFNVSMEEPMAVDIIQRRSYLLNDVSDLLVRKRVII